MKKEQNARVGSEPLRNWAASSYAGVCVRDSESRVLFQNDACERNCGAMTGKVCLEGCMKLSESSVAANENADTLRFYRRAPLRNGVSDVVRIDNRSCLTTIFLPLDSEIAFLKTQMSQAGLSKREQEVAHLVLQGKSNLEITTELFISRATLKTHLNTIYRKQPQLKRIGVRRRTP